MKRPVAGDPAPPLVGELAGGGRLDLAELRPRPVLVEFFRGTW
jgi:hypothetical protein